jgi:hypothetical protein
MRHPSQRVQLPSVDMADALLDEPLRADRARAQLTMRPLVQSQCRAPALSQLTIGI